MSSVVEQADLHQPIELRSGLGHHSRIVPQILQPQNGMELQQVIEQAYLKNCLFILSGKATTGGTVTKHLPVMVVRYSILAA